MPKDQQDEFYSEMDPEKKKYMSVSEIMHKLDYVYKMVTDYTSMKSKFDNMELKLKLLEKNQESFVTNAQLETQTSSVLDDVTEKTYHMVNKVNDKVNSLEKNKMDTGECNQKLAGFAPVKALEKFNQTIFEMKTEIERNIERKFNDEISALKFKIENSIKEDDVHILLED